MTEKGIKFIDKIQALADKIYPEDGRIVRELLQRCLEFEMDSEMHGRIIDGTWPNADDIIKKKREEIKDDIS